MSLNSGIKSKLRAALACCTLLLPTFALWAGEIQSLASIRMQAESYVMSYPYESPYPPGLKLGNLDSRLRLKACQQPLSIEFSRPGKVYGNTALLVRCPVQSGWKIHLPARIDVFDDVIVAAKPLLRGQFIDASAIAFQKHNIARLNNGYYSKNSALDQLQAGRNLSRGAVLTPSNLAPKLLVRSGQQVTLVLNYNGLQIKSTGKALQSARLGDVVRVRNSQSQRIVEGVVSGEALVRVGI
ncbi:MAG: flagellar basal body P-ring formation chaperone FlgA [Gammaproteobacteria bacterium]|nr:flagellar basal body P-ring formation chaperone FlgA [Gammaproteobacteria bacterium]MDH3449435.1 flagellar basal body P-ring formation chaperone FlgA [Gammaproteobacteria bacterium]